MVFKTKDEVRSLSKILRKLSCWWCGQSENYNRQGRGRKEEKGKNKDGKLVGIFVIIKLKFKFFAPIVFCVISQIQLRKIIFCREKKRNGSSNRTIKNAKVCRLYN